MADEECAARRAVEHAFADPDTVADEVRALAAGILVTGSAASLPFSPGGVAALESARDEAAASGRREVRPALLLACALARLPQDLCSAVDEAGYERAGLEAAAGEAGQIPAAAPAGSLFRRFSEEAKRCLSAAARLAREGDGRSIGPAHLVLACLQSQRELERAAGLSASRLRVLLRERMRDPTPLPQRRMEPDAVFQAFLAALPEGADSLALLLRCHAGLTPELAQVLLRHRVTPALLERSAGAFRDPQS
jgi:ATP-dependent Clp protease ATP-binding subunit ClpA